MYEITFDEKEKVDSIGEKSGFDGEKVNLLNYCQCCPQTGRWCCGGGWEVINHMGLTPQAVHTIATLHDLLREPR